MNFDPGNLSYCRNLFSVSFTWSVPENQVVLLGEGSFLQKEIGWKIQWSWHFGKMPCTVSGTLDIQGFVCLFNFCFAFFFSLCIMLFIFLCSQETKSYFLYSLLIKIYILCIAGNKQKHQKPTKTFNYQVICFENFVLIAIVYFS